MSLPAPLLQTGALPVVGVLLVLLAGVVVLLVARGQGYQNPPDPTEEQVCPRCRHSTGAADDVCPECGEEL